MFERKDVFYGKYRFSSCYDQDSSQEEIFCNDVEPLLDVVYSGVVSAFLDLELDRC